MTTICLFTPFDAPAGIALAKALLDAGYVLALVETGGTRSSGAAPHWTDTPAVLDATRNADLVVYWVDARGAAPAGLGWIARVPGVLCIEGAAEVKDAVARMAISEAAGVIATDTHPAVPACAGPVHMVAVTTPKEWAAVLSTFGPQAMLALPLRGALHQFGATLEGWGALPELIAALSFDGSLDVLRSGHQFL